MKYRELLDYDVDVNLFNRVETDSQTFNEMVGKARLVKSLDQFRSLTAECSLGVGQVSKVDLFKAMTQTLGDLGVLSNLEAFTAFNFILSKSIFTSHSLKTLMTLFTYTTLKKKLKEHHADFHLTAQDIFKIAEVMNVVFNMDDQVDRVELLRAIKASADPLAFTQDYVSALPSFKALNEMLEGYTYNDPAHKIITIELAHRFLENLASVLVQLSKFENHDSRWNMEAIFKITGVFTQFSISLYLTGIRREFPGLDVSLAPTIKNILDLAIRLQCLDDFGDSISDGNVYDGKTGINIFRSLVYQHGQDRLDRLNQMQEMDFVELSNTFPKEVVTFFLALRQAPSSEHMVQLFRNSILLQEFKQHL